MIGFSIRHQKVNPIRKKKNKNQNKTSRGKKRKNRKRKKVTRNKKRTNNQYGIVKKKYSKNCLIPF